MYKKMKFLFTSVIFISAKIVGIIALNFAKDVLYDVPVSNHGARIRLISRLKKIDLDIRNPQEIGGLKSPDFSKLSIHSKMPVMVTSSGFTIMYVLCSMYYTYMR